MSGKGVVAQSDDERIFVLCEVRIESSNVPVDLSLQEERFRQRFGAQGSEMRN